MKALMQNRQAGMCTQQGESVETLQAKKHAAAYGTPVCAGIA